MTSEYLGTKIAVVIPTYNRSKYVGRSIESVLRQTIQPNEIIVVNDGSTDDTLSVLRDYGSTIKVIDKKNAGVSEARNTGILHAESEWIAFLDDDDEYLPHRLMLIHESINRFPQAVVHASNIQIISSDGSETDLFTLRGLRCVDFEPIRRPLAWAVGGCSFSQGMVVRRSVLIEQGLYKKMFYEDMDLYVRLAFLGFWAVSRSPSIKLIRRPGENFNLSTMWRSKPVENFTALRQIYCYAYARYDELDQSERALFRSLIASVSFQLGGAFLLAGRVEDWRAMYREGLKMTNKFKSRLKIQALLLLGPTIARLMLERQNSIAGLRQ